MNGEKLLYAVAVLTLGLWPRDIDQLSWMQGCWEMTTARGSVEEQWMGPRGGIMLGMNRSIRDGRTSGIEFLSIRAAPGGGAIYEARPGGHDATAFTADALSDTSVTFENSAHDFPKQITYNKIGDDMLHAWISNAPADSLRRADFRFHKVACQ